jgi:monoamine oxidase
MWGTFDNLRCHCVGNRVHSYGDHAWVFLPAHDMILDITAKQFGRKFPPVVMTARKDLHYSYGRRRTLKYLEQGGYDLVERVCRCYHC